MENKIITYLVVCPTKKRAAAKFKDLKRHLSYKQTTSAACFDRTLRMFVAHTDIRFISKREFYDASRGFHGFVVDESDVTKWLDAAENN